MIEKDVVGDVIEDEDFFQAIGNSWFQYTVIGGFLLYRFWTEHKKMILFKGGEKTFLL